MLIMKNMRNGILAPRELLATCDGHAGPPYPTLLVTMLTPPPRPDEGPGSLILCPACVITHYQAHRPRRAA